MRGTVRALAHWVTDHHAQIQDARSRYDAE
ncbi:hypothetical protein [Streptomyces sp. YKOK-I1]